MANADIITLAGDNASKHISPTLTAREERTIYSAIGILEKQLKRTPGAALNGVGAIRDYLKLRLSREERELFVVLFLNTQLCLIEAETMFYGTLTQCNIYPREVVKRALYHNAGAVILVHNHPSGVAEPSTSDEYLTNALKQALSYVDVRVLDHFIVAGSSAFSFEEHAMIEGYKKIAEEIAAKKKKTHKPRAKILS
jgi:DNA repair protein RadC